MRNTLKYILFGAVLAAAGIGAGVAIERSRDMKLNLNLSFPSAEKIEKTKNLEDYLLPEGELAYANKISIEGKDMQNGAVVNVDDFGSGKEQAKEYNISREKITEYIIPKIEDSSKEENLFLKVLEFKSAKDVKDAIESKKLQLDYPYFVKENLLITLSSDLPDITGLSQKQKQLYDKVLSNYSKKIGVSPVVSQDEEEEVISTSNNSNSIFANSSGANTDSNTVSNSASIFSSQPANSAASDGLESLFLNEKEKNGIKILTMEDEAKLLDTTTKKVSEASLTPMYQYNSRSILSGNPYTYDETGVKEIRNHGWELRNLDKFGEAIYFIPSGKQEKQDTGNTAFVNLSVYKFDSRKDAEKAIRDMEGYSKGIDYLILTEDDAIIVFDAKNQINSPMQAELYTKALLDYKARTGAKISAINEQTQNYLEETLAKANKAIKNPSLYNFNSAETILESYFASTEESREAAEARAESIKRALAN